MSIIEFLVWYVLIVSSLVLLFGIWWVGMHARYGWYNKQVLPVVFKQLNKLQSKTWLLRFVRTLCFVQVSSWLILAGLQADAMGFEWFATISLYPTQLSTSIGTIAGDFQYVWFTALLLGVVGIKGAFLIDRIAMLLQSDIIVVGHMGQWGPASRIVETYR